MAKKRYKIKIKGLVRTMNEVRDRLSVGMTKDRAKAFYGEIREVVEKVEKDCREAKVTPEDLPTPSYRAYKYLRDIKLKDIPITAEHTPRKVRKVRMSGVVSGCERFHPRFHDLIAPPGQGKPPRKSEVKALAAELANEAETIEALLEEIGAEPGELPIRSRRGYQWLRFLGVEENLARHLGALHTLTRAAHEATKGIGRLPYIRIYNESYLHRTRFGSDGIDIRVNEGFIDAPDETLAAIVRAALKRGDDVDNTLADNTLIRTYAASSAYEEVRMALAAATPLDVSATAQGVHHNLQEAFDRVNRAYFKGRQSLPRLVWSRTRTFRKFGHYDSRQDQVMISRTLDARNVPDYVIDFVVYHELLHREIGTPVVEGRRRAHTSTFRKRERAYNRYEEAEAHLTRLARAVRGSG